MRCEQTAEEGQKRPEKLSLMFDVSGGELTVLELGQRKPLAQGQDSLLFTHFGLSGPAILNVSRVVSGLYARLCL